MGVQYPCLQVRKRNMGLFLYLCPLPLYWQICLFSYLELDLDIIGVFLEWSVHWGANTQKQTLHLWLLGENYSSSAFGPSIVYIHFTSCHLLWEEWLVFPRGLITEQTVWDYGDDICKENQLELGGLCSIQRCHFHGRDRCHRTYRTSRLDCSEHTADKVHLMCLFFRSSWGLFQNSLFPPPCVWPSQRANFCITRFLSPRLCCRA